MNPAYNQNYPKKVEIDIYSSMNTWMGATFTVDATNEHRAQEVLDKAWDAYWDDPEAECECYGNWLESAMKKARIKYKVAYINPDSDRED